MIFEKEEIKYKEADSKEVAKERLKKILMRDRVDVSSEAIESVRQEIIGVVKDYFVVKERGSEVYLTNMRRGKDCEDENVLVALIPISKSIKRIISEEEAIEEIELV